MTVFYAKAIIGTDPNQYIRFMPETETSELFLTGVIGLPGAFSARSRKLFWKNRATEISWRSFSIQTLILKRDRNAENQPVLSFPRGVSNTITNRLDTFFAFH